MARKPPAPGRPPVRPAAPPPPKPASPPPRPNPSKPPAPGRPPAPGKPPTPPAGKPTPGPVVRGPGGSPKTKPPKPAGNPGPGRSWVFKNGSWVAERKTVAANVSAPAGATGGRTQTGNNGSVVLGAPASDADTGVDTGDAGVGAAVEPPVTSKTPEQIAADVAKSAQSSVAMRDPALAGRYTSETTGLGGLGIKYTKAGGGTATYEDIFGSVAPGSSVDRSKFEVRDALGRVVNRDLLGSDVYGGAAATDIAGTALGNEILGARRAAASEAEGRSSSGVSGGGLRNAAGEVQGQREGAAITGLLGKLYGIEGDITNERTKTYQDALETAAGGDIGRWAPEPSAPAGGSTPPPAEPKPKPVKPKPVKPNVPKAPGGSPKTKPPKPAGNPGPGRKWVYNAKSNSWQAARR